LAVVECHRAVTRAGGAASRHASVDRVLASCTVLRFDEALIRLAGRIGPAPLRSLDAIHLASALSIGDYPEAFVTYDERLADAARAVGLKVLTPEA
jgi:predicted nucleic acid-binding protein